MSTPSDSLDRLGMGKLLKISDVARMAGWCCPIGEKKQCKCKVCRAGYRRMARQLRAVNRQLNGLLMSNVATPGCKARWRLTEGALRQMHPQWFVHQEAVEDQLRYVREKLVEQTELVEIAHRHIGDLRREVESIKARMRRPAGPVRVASGG